MPYEATTGDDPRMRRLPIFVWVHDYRRTDLRGDLLAGLTGAALLIPQSMAYAQLGGVPPVVGLYASVIPAFAYACFGLSRQLTIGPLSTLAIIGALAVADLAHAESARFVALTATLALMVGVIGILFGFARLGRLMRFAREPLIVGFLAGAAVVIMANQLDELFGFHVLTEPRVLDIVIGWARHLDETDVTALTIGLVGIVGLAVTRRFGRIPSALVYIVGATVVVWLSGADVVVVGEVPSGLAGFSVPPLEWAVVRSLAPAAFVIMVVGYVESYGVTRRLADEHGYPIDANRQLFSTGGANVTSGFFGGMPVTGVPSRTAALDEAGARTQLAALVAAATVVPVLLFGTALLHDIPRSALAAVVIVSIAGFIRIGEFRRLWRDARFDAWIALVAFAGVVALGLEWGVLVTAGAAAVDAVVARRRSPGDSDAGDDAPSD